MMHLHESLLPEGRLYMKPQRDSLRIVFGTEIQSSDRGLPTNRVNTVLWYDDAHNNSIVGAKYLNGWIVL